MPPDYFSRFFPAVCAGFGLFLAGGVNLLLLRRGVWLRLLATIVAVGVALGAAWSLDQPGAVAGAARLLGLGLIPFLALGSGRLVRGLTVLVTAASRPTVRFGLLTTAGLGTAIGSLVVYEIEDEEALSAPTSELELLEANTGRVKQAVPSSRAAAYTDQGTRIMLEEPRSLRDRSALDETENLVLQRTHQDERLIRRGPAGDQSNCHGWVFAGGRFHIAAGRVELILRENGYREIHDPQPGDLVVFRNNGEIVHSAIVRYVADGQPLLVESKWGSLGVYVHPVEESPYGTNYTIQRSARNGHLLVGLGGDASTQGNPKISAAE